MFKDCVLWVVTNLLLSSAANQTTKPVFDAILEATGENGKTSGKSFDDRKVIFGRAKAGSETESQSRAATLFSLVSLFTRRLKTLEKCRLSTVHAKREKVS